jgi:hypothetical protein
MNFNNNKQLKQKGLIMEKNLILAIIASGILFFSGSSSVLVTMENKAQYTYFDITTKQHLEDEIKKVKARLKDHVFLNTNTKSIMEEIINENGIKLFCAISEIINTKFLFYPPNDSPAQLNTNKINHTDGFKQVNDQFITFYNDQKNDYNGKRGVLMALMAVLSYFLNDLFAPMNFISIYKTFFESNENYLNILNEKTPLGLFLKDIDNVLFEEDKKIYLFFLNGLKDYFPTEKDDIVNKGMSFFDFENNFLKKDIDNEIVFNLDDMQDKISYVKMYNIRNDNNQTITAFTANVTASKNENNSNNIEVELYPGSENVMLKIMGQAKNFGIKKTILLFGGAIYILAEGARLFDGSSPILYLWDDFTDFDNTNFGLMCDHMLKVVLIPGCVSAVYGMAGITVSLWNKVKAWSFKKKSLNNNNKQLKEA